MTGTPDPKSGIRIVPLREMMDMLKDPKMREAIDTCERVEGHEKAIKQIIRKQATHSRAANLSVQEHEKGVEYFNRKR